MKNTATLLVWIYLCLSYPTDLCSQILINEFYADVATGSVGDANGDGIRSAREDEFIELVNPTTATINITGYTIWVSENLRHTFDSTLLAPNSAIVVFGGGQPTGIFGDSQVITASTGSLSLGNSGSKVELKNAQGIILEEFTYPDENTNTSWTRDPDITGGFKSHFQVVASYGIPYSPGTLSNSFPFNSSENTLVQFQYTSGTVVEGDSVLQLPIYLINPSSTKATTIVIKIIAGTSPVGDNFFQFENSFLFLPGEEGLLFFPVLLIDDNQVEGIQTFLFSIEQVAGGNHAMASLQQQFTVTLEDNDYDFPLLLNEILADPPTGIEGDANSDGIRDSKEDEFLEFVNISEETLDISNFQIWDTNALRHEIPEGTIVAPNQAFVIFGGGMPNGDFGNSIVQTASTGSLNLLNTGDKIILKDTSGVTVYAYVYGSEASDNQSITRYPDLAEGDIAIPHTSVGNGALFSPGKGVEAADFSVTTSSNADVLNRKIAVFPNPSKSVFYVESSVEILDMELHNYQGQGIITTTESVLNVELEAGVYLLKIKTVEGYVMRKLSVLD